MQPRLFELSTDSVDNFVGNWFLKDLTNGFYYSFVNLNTFKAAIIFILLSIS
jgi:hypothetical protein